MIRYNIQVLRDLLYSTVGTLIEKKEKKKHTYTNMGGLSKNLTHKIKLVKTVSWLNLFSNSIW